jgi:predicted CXXCH cytochrome family protein
MWIRDGFRRVAAAGAATFVAIVLTAACGDDAGPEPVVAPDAPTGVEVVVDRTTALVTWTPGAGATSQAVTVRDVAAEEADRELTFPDNVTAAATFRALTPGKDYAADVTARNTVGTATSDLPAAFSIQGVPASVTVAAGTVADTVTLTWALSDEATSYRAELTGGTAPLVQVLGGTAIEARFTDADDGLEDGVTYTATVHAVNDIGESTSNQPPVTTNFFPWDEYFSMSLHETGAGKTTYYDEVPNRGFEEYTNVAYADLACIGCHSSASGLAPVSGRTCDRCHDTVDPQLGAVVNTSWTDGVCMGCHSRQGLEMSLYTDVHRDMGFDCMSCHTLDDVMGDGNDYLSLQDIGAIDSECTDCHDASTHSAAANPHPDLGLEIACASCHAQSTVTCNNCHFEAQVNNTGKFFLEPPAHDWMWLGNRLKRDGSGETEVYPVNYQSVAYLDTTFVAFGFYTPHTIGLAATARGCSDCHNNRGGTNAAIIQYNTDGFIDVAKWNAGTSNMDYPTGVVPLPEDYLTSLRFDFATSADNGVTWTFLKAGADTIQILPQYVTPLSAAQMTSLGMTGP